MFPRRHARETIQAFEKIASEFPELKLIMVGKDKYPSPIIDGLIDKTNKKLMVFTLSANSLITGFCE